MVWNSLRIQRVRWLFSQERRWLLNLEIIFGLLLAVNEGRRDKEMAMSGQRSQCWWDSYEWGSVQNGFDFSYKVCVSYPQINIPLFLFPIWLSWKCITIFLRRNKTWRSKNLKLYLPKGRVVWIETELDVFSCTYLIFKYKKKAWGKN